MAIPFLESDRRRELRRPAAGRLTWGTERLPGPYAAYKSDESGRSMSFVTTDSADPVLGEELLVEQAGGLRQRWRVTRMAQYGADLRLVACRRILEPVCVN